VQQNAHAVPGQGIGFWEWFAPGQKGPQSEGGGQGLYGIYATDSTFKLIQDNVAFINGLASDAPPGCNSKAAPVVPVKNCSSTHVNGLPGTGCVVL
jgi:mannan endo-1,4-beta-mannosidase